MFHKSNKIVYNKLNYTVFNIHTKVTQKNKFIIYINFFKQAHIVYKQSYNTLYGILSFNRLVFFINENLLNFLTLISQQLLIKGSTVNDFNYQNNHS